MPSVCPRQRAPHHPTFHLQAINQYYIAQGEVGERRARSALALGEFFLCNFACQYNYEQDL
jgi:hypothetical protein